MNLSLQPKRYINSQHTGQYVKITVPYGKKATPIEVNIHYRDEGSGEPLILIHSLGQSLYTWRHIMPALVNKYRVIAIELIGNGYSDKPQYCDYLIEDHAEVIRQVMDKLNISSAHFVAFSMGCGYVCRLMSICPERVARVILMSPGGLTQDMPTFVRMMNSRLLGAIGALCINPKNVEEALQRCFLDLTLVTPEMVNGYFETLNDADTRHAIRTSIMNYNEDTALSGLRDVTTPTRILLGTDDRWHSEDDVALYQAAMIMTEAEFGIVRNAGHLMHEEQPEKIIETITTFIPPKQQ